MDRALLRTGVGERDRRGGVAQVVRAGQHTVLADHEAAAAPVATDADHRHARGGIRVPKRPLDRSEHIAPRGCFVCRVIFVHRVSCRSTQASCVTCRSLVTLH